MTELVFMSPEHVAAMNSILGDDATVRAACAELEKPFTLGYELTDGPDGEPVYWSMTFADTVRFGLDKVDADLLFTGDWTRMIRATRAGRTGQASDPGVTAVGDAEAFAAVAPVFAAAQAVATMPVQFPDV